MKHYNYLYCFIMAVIACNPVQRITGNKPNGSHYTVTIEPASNLHKGDSVKVDGKIQIANYTVEEAAKIATKGLVIWKYDSMYRKIIQPDSFGYFSCVIPPGKYYCVLMALGYGSMRTKVFKVRNGEVLNIVGQLHPEIEYIDDTIPLLYKTVPRRYKVNDEKNN